MADENKHIVSAACAAAICMFFMLAVQAARAESDFDLESRASDLDQLGEKYQEALPLRQELLRRARSVSGPTSPETLTALAHLARVQGKLGDHTAALQQFAEGVKIVNGLTVGARASTLPYGAISTYVDALTEYVEANGTPNDARQVLARALKPVLEWLARAPPPASEKGRETDDREAELELRAALVKGYIALGEANERNAALQEFFRSADTAYDQGVKAVSILSLTSDLAFAAANRRDGELSRLVNGWQAGFEERHVKRLEASSAPTDEILDALNSLARTYALIDRKKEAADTFARAAQYAEKAATAIEARSSPSSLDIAKARMRAGVAWRWAGDLPRAAAALERAATVCAADPKCADGTGAREPGAGEPFPVDRAALGAARLFQRLGDDARAKPMADLGVRILEARIEKLQGVLQLVALMSLTEAYRQAGRLEDAAKTWERIARHPAEAASARGAPLSLAAASYADMGNYRRAIPLEREAIDAMLNDKRNPFDSESESEIRSMLRYLRAAGDYDHAFKIVGSMLSDYKSVGEERIARNQAIARQYAGWIQARGELLSDQGRHRDALLTFQYAFTVLRKTFPDHSDEVIDAGARIVLETRAVGDLARCSQLANVLLNAATTPAAQDIVARKLAPTLFDLGETDRARTLLESVSRQSEKTGNLIAGLSQGLDEDDQTIRIVVDATRRIAAKVRIKPLIDLGIVQMKVGEAASAAQTLGRALEYARAAGDTRSVDAVRLLAALGKAELDAGNELAAVRHAKQARLLAVLILPRGNPDRVTALLSAAEVMSKAGTPAEAVRFFEQAQGELSASPDTLLKAEVQFAYAQHFARAGQANLAIFLAKSAVNSIQSARELLQAGADRQIQELFARSRSTYYETLAGWLIDQGRLAEAHQVLAMMKEREFFDYVRGDAKTDPRGTRAAFTPQEEQWHKRYEAVSGRLAALGAEEERLQAKAPRGLTQAEQKRQAEVAAALRAARTAFGQFIGSLEKEAQAAGPFREKQVGNLGLYTLKELQATLGGLGKGVVTLHYVMEDQRLSILLTTPSVQIARTKHVKRAELNRKVEQFRRVLQDPSADPLPMARELYDILIAPVAEDLRQANARTLMVSLDGALRYIPVAALYDGERFLIERFRIDMFTEVARDKLKERPKIDWRLAGLGVTHAIGDFDALPSVRDELESIVIRGGKGVLPGDIYLDQAFTVQRLRESLAGGYGVLHVASHFVFRPGTEANSYLLLGDGTHLSLRDVKKDHFDFRDLDLITLSACETALGGGRAANGEEIEGLGALVQREGANAVIATLWPVADRSTGIFMYNFYRFREGTPRENKAEALREAQLEFIHGRRYAHPFFWAPFILMGNWL